MNDRAMETETFDVLIVGSGAGGLLAACRAADLGLSVLVIEKSAQYGGTSAVSGGGIWVPCNHHIAEAGGTDTREAARTYIEACTQGAASGARLDAYLDTAPEMLRYLEARTPVRYQSLSRYADYFQNQPGAMPGYRALDPLPFDGARLGAEFTRLRDPSPGTLIGGRVAVTSKEAHVLLAKERGFIKLALREFGRYWLNIGARLRSRRDTRLTLGNALVGGLRYALLERKVPLWLSTPMRELIEESGRIVGVVAEREGKPVRVLARRGVILAAGGFERNQALRERYLPQPTEAQWSATPPHNTGDAIVAGEQAGGALALMEHVWGAPTVRVEGEEKQRALFVERNLPGCVIVNGLGKRFVNEAAPYSEFVPAMYRDHAATGKSVPAWMVFDARFRKRYPCGPIMPASMMPDSRIPAAFRSLLHRADSLDALAAQIGVDAAGLRETVVRMNRYAASGVDEEFGKGGNVFDTYYGDPSVQPNPCLAPIGEGPFYAVRIDAGDIGTKGGLVTDENARVLRADGSAIAGLYAIGNTSASMMGASYPGAGSTLGPAMTFGYRAANTLADVVPAGAEASASVSSVSIARQGTEQGRELRGVTQ
ncbi:FAD-dependent oxidoreductase [Paraburkholderia silviterrae]|uniref:3-oxosteroid 1-dehydrogenase n=1 Tax=Paraburkholderia silviterrae TaxID=2528715 RepID=A0A4V2ZY68_9BURK|nr:FAD-dependent oxidoreductase [Paraburkholderia silviterrae]TDG18918.1 FAD-dependent oxidoreductase [Paraburkholderia silviterrae]